ncbi:MAG: multi-sensor signal transduction histidine kinase [Conexibacter sp.]|nr:multi-sensor signal transduction histidine kinase [Conexibacter sp.]
MRRPAMSDLLAPGTPIDLENCAREPIHTPGAIQPHGFLLAARAGDMVVVQASANAGELLERPFDVVLGASLGALLGVPLVDELARRASDVDVPNLRPLRASVAGRPADAFAYRADALLIVEVELVVETGRPSFDAFQDEVTRSLTEVQDADGIDALLRTAAQTVRRLTSFDRVWVYRFEPDEHGVVVAEEQDDGRPSFLGLHYPATDIPPQARALFLRNRLRLIPDVEAPAVPLVPLENPVSGAWLDLSFGVLRAVSPIHISYLQSMGATASMSIALAVEGRLWGLISAHHYDGPRHVSHEVRAACEFLGRVTSMQLAALGALAVSRQRTGLEHHRRALLEKVAGAPSVAHGLADAEAELLATCAADGVAVRIGDELELRGRTPPPAAVLALLDDVRERDGADIFCTDALGTVLPAHAALAQDASGVLAATLSRGQGNVIAWFRGEWEHTVNWGHRTAQDAGAEPALGPHGSFDQWAASVRGTSRPWLPAEVDSVVQLRSALGTFVLSRAEELAELNGRLARSNAELDAFAYVAAHDLKEPLRGISNYATFLAEDHGEALHAGGREQLATIARLARRMDGLLDALLEYSRIERADLELGDVTLGELVDDARELVESHLSRPGVELIVHGDWQVVRADREHMRHLLANLLSNAVKYTEDPICRIEVDTCRLADTRRGDALAGARAAGHDGPLVVRVRDNGIGIASQDAEVIFRVFRRLHAREAHGGGTGAGLTIARRIAERHGGMLWLDAATPGHGATFCFTLEPA